MGVTATLPATVIDVEPGREATCDVTITNTGGIVDLFTVEVVGEAAAWTQAEGPEGRPEISLMPGQAGTVTLRFRPPRSTDIPVGEVPFAVRVFSQGDPHGSDVEEGTVRVGAFCAITAELSPAIAEGSTKAKYEVIVDNAGNHPVDVELRPTDLNNNLDFRLDRTRFTLEPGTAGFIALRARPRQRFLRGQPKRHPFTVLAVLSVGDPRSIDGTMVQRQLLPRWLVPALIALLLLAGVLTALWLAVLRPAVQSTARAAAEQKAVEQVNEQVAGVKNAAEQAGTQADTAQKAAGQAEVKANEALKAQGIDPTSVTGGSGSPPTRVSSAAAGGTPTDFRIPEDASIATNAGSSRNFTFTPGDGSKTLLVTDLVLQNPRGDRGTLQILRDKDGSQTVLLEVGLNNFRDLDQHWVQPWQFRPGENIVVSVNCENPPEAGSGCTPAVSFSGRLLDS